MSVEEARRRGLIGKPRLVPEDFGASETEGAPVEGAKIPRMRYSMESKPKVAAAQPQAMPDEWREGIDPKVAPILKSLEAAAAADPESVDLSAKAAEKSILEQKGQAGVDQFRKQVAKSPPPVAPPAVAQAPAPPPAAAPRRKRVAQVVTPSEPAPVAAPTSVVATPGPVLESPIMGGRPNDMPQPNLDEDNSGPVTAADRGSMPIKCGACGKEFKYQSWYIRHVKQIHKDRLAELMPHEGP